MLVLMRARVLFVLMLAVSNLWLRGDSRPHTVQQCVTGECTVEKPNPIATGGKEIGQPGLGLAFGIMAIANQFSRTPTKTVPAAQRELPPRTTLQNCSGLIGCDLSKAERNRQLPSCAGQVGCSLQPAAAAADEDDRWVKLEKEVKGGYTRIHKTELTEDEQAIIDSETYGNANARRREMEQQQQLQQQQQQQQQQLQQPQQQQNEEDDEKEGTSPQPPTPSPTPTTTTTTTTTTTASPELAIALQRLKEMEQELEKKNKEAERQRQEAERERQDAEKQRLRADGLEQENGELRETVKRVGPTDESSTGSDRVGVPPQPEVRTPDQNPQTVGVGEELYPSEEDEDDCAKDEAEKEAEGIAASVEGHEVPSAVSTTTTTTTKGCSYVYLLLDSRRVEENFTNAIDYVGVGTSALRPLQHLGKAAAPQSEYGKEPSKKIARIREIWEAGGGVLVLRLFYSTKKEALVREAALIQTIGLSQLTNEISGSAPGRTKAELLKLGRELLPQAMAELQKKQNGPQPLQPIRKSDIEKRVPWLIHADDKHHVCGECGKAFTQSGQLTIHMRVHTNTRPYPCTFPGCGHNSKTSGQLSDHMRVHTNTRPYPCTFPGCGHNFKTSGQLNEHMRVHTNARPYPCTHPGCNQAFTQSGHLSDHMRVHTNARPYPCTHPGCGKACKTSSDRTKHMRVHTNASPYPCTHPGCGHNSKTSGQLSDHMRTHTNARPYPCTYPGCGKACKNSGDRTKHMRIHTNARPYPCTYPGCGKAFSQSGNLQTHMRIHTNDKPFVCPHCTYRATTKCHLNRHIKLKHSKKEEKVAEDDSESEKSKDESDDDSKKSGSN